jgi:hypothetical protein
MKEGTGEIAGHLLAEIETWRDRLGKNIALRNPNLSSGELNTAVHAIISRIIFLRICEERGIMRLGTLRGLLEGDGVYRRLSGHFPHSDGQKDSAPPHSPAPDLTIDGKVLEEIREQLYGPGSSQEYSAITPFILGQVYDQFLGKALRLRGGHHARVEEKPEVKTAGGDSCTPQFIVDYIVSRTVGGLVEGKIPGEVSRVRILDPACGSGSFLIAACQFLFDWHRDWYTRNLVPALQGKGSITAPYVQALIPGSSGLRAGKEGSPRDLPICKVPGGGESGRNPGWMLTTAERERILLDTLYGVDIDPRAVEVTQLTLLLMVLWEVNREMTMGEMGPIADRVLRCLDRHIRCGNSLIGPDFFRQKQVAPYNFGEQKKINPFDWNSGFSGIMDSGGFDGVIGHPPSTRERSLKGVEEYFQTHYRTYHGEADLSVYFIERGISLLRPGGIFCTITANRWLRTSSGTPLRRWLKEKQIEEIVDFGDLQEYRNAMTYPCLLRVRNTPASTGFRVSRPDTSSFQSLGDYIAKHHHPVDPGDLSDRGWTLADSRTEVLLGKIREAGTPLDSLIIPRDDKYLLGVLSSRLAHLFGKAYGVRMPRDSSPPARVVPKNFPVYVPDFDEPADAARHDRMVALVTRMLDLHKSLQDTIPEHEKTVIRRKIEAMDQEIDELVYELYGLTEEERRIVEEATGGNKKGA